jgi:hypothetical protein
MAPAGPGGLYADLKTGAGFARLPLDSPGARQALRDAVREPLRKN